MLCVMFCSHESYKLSALRKVLWNRKQEQETGTENRNRKQEQKTGTENMNRKQEQKTGTENRNRKVGIEGSLYCDAATTVARERMASSSSDSDSDSSKSEGSGHSQYSGVMFPHF